MGDINRSFFGRFGNNWSWVKQLREAKMREMLHWGDFFKRSCVLFLRTLIFRRKGNFEGNSGDRKGVTWSALRINEGVK